ncbi:hypothetical protein B9Q02_10210 [Candidatus Marsarchaeota G1 archaeon BE_D]|uniref:CARDB domain-containing protein n=1 Tax=Candidatus Marsarchaeota G1 archaeon BE_D TaxID=1978156 RepID=A0A2R6ABQ1_9ARCH|nr:MAG: hypothetical protein B9Q02_10210 [Candidatus Marsarchaeota G1 archaeon BE_D]
MAKTRRHKRAIESYIAVIILVIVTLAIGVALYTYFNGLVAHNQVNTGLEITSVSLSAPSGGTTGYLSITVQNTGSLAFNSINIYFGGSSVTTSCSPAPPSSLAPGNSFSTVCSVTATAGNEYAVYVSASTSTGSSVSSSVVNVIAQG